MNTLLISISATEPNKEHRKQLKKTGFWGKRGAGCLFLARDTGRLLVAHRSDHVQEPGTWGTWGGAIDEAETPKQAVRREVKEESGYKGKLNLISLSVFEHSSGFKYYNFLAVVASEFVPDLDHETQGFRWVSTRWPRPLHPGLKELLSIPKNIEIISNQINLRK